MIAPTVLAAYTPPTSRPASCPRAATAASASGKLAPHRIVAGRIAQRQRTRSIWKLNHGLREIEGLIGQYGRDFASAKALQAIAAASSSWHQPRAILGGNLPRERNEPTLLPIPNPTRNTARMMEKV